ncbi:hypothetical protein A1F94_003743 [Pyrenophora tritici-repentis]|uniref:Uncharacterized protein n=2 Tax=Pyrenophora tritici-repentis TaxID=45151 RepID=A0A2W1H6D6_9PLEO|nr:uncharacterized protein PTRG_02313 [Pyrenophora tritici-repentis Pt-1C-BFP]KAA8623654.1 hypothetical protein PtrV1_04960 [Pyrenophora tritici-repentis]EDU44836.1 predicted protein [Pyrenophora tritici-repentis Pt-1C-BFP]KAF7452670.1 hypothetical protein A1F99_044480 [Pyrenophora tritici-repentis]KAF7574197.1 hypothetical protein PtrM4_058200 [Pyrenophora tritici-repentis]KAG9386993.1 hypothetical protein A1F94_003743 [Pyrenophora tritici-repentis]
MVLRSDAWILFDDGLLFFDENHDDVQARSETSDQSHPWSLIRVKNNALSRKMVLTDWKRIATLQGVEIMEAPASCDAAPPEDQSRITGLLKTLQGLLDWQVEKGLTVLNVGIPNSAYSMAQYRRAMKPLDRIFGIIQTYGISCNPDPAGDDNSSKLRALQDEFGMKLITKAPVLSQLFIHTLHKERPWRSWLITQDIKADDIF